MNWLIEISHLNRRFGSVTAVQDVNFRVAEGEIFGLVGPDGAGKTTTLRLLCGAYLPTHISDQETIIRVGGYDVLKETEFARSQLGYLSQRFSLYEDLTVLENIRFFAEIRGLSSKEWYPRCMEILDFVGLVDFKDRRAGQLSGGMKQKLGLASALVSRPRILLLDEPTTGVDPVTRQDFWQLIIHLVATPQNGQGVCVLITTPYMDEASRCHRLAFMRGGKIISEGTADQLRATLNERIVELRGSPLPLLRRVAAQNPEVEDVTAFGDRLHLRMKKNLEQATIESLKSSIIQTGGHFDQARLILPSLEDVFIDLANREE